MKTGWWHNFVTSLFVVLACLSIVATTMLVWFQQTTLNTNQFVNIVATSTEDPQVVESISLRLSDQVVTALDVENRLTELLPDRLDPLAGRFALALEDRIAEAVSDTLSSPGFQETWRRLLTATHGGLVGLLRGEATNAQIVDGTLTIDVIGIANVAIERLRADGVIPETIQVPDVSAEPNRQAVLDRLSTALNTRLPDDFGIIKVANASRLQTASTVVRFIDVLSIVMVLVSAGLTLLALRWANRNWRAALAVVTGVVAISALLMLALNFLSDGAAGVIEAPDGHALLAATVKNLADSFTDWLAILITASVAVGVLAVVWHFTFGRNAEGEEQSFET